MVEESWDCANRKLQRNAMDSVLADIEVADPTAAMDSDEKMADVAPRAVQKQEKQKKDKEKRKEKGENKGENKGEEGAAGEKKKKRKHGEVNGDGGGKKEKKVKY